MALGASAESVVIGSTWYRFKIGRGVVRNDARAIPETFSVSPRGTASADDIEYLETNVGSGWTLRHNCLTVFARFRRRSLPYLKRGQR